MDKPPHLVMVTTAERGGMRAVVEAYEADGVFSRWNVRLLYAHVEGSALRRACAAALALAQFAILLVRRRVALLHCHVAMGASFWRKSLFANLARLFRVPVILHLHGSDLEIFHAARGRFGKWLIARELRQADRVLVLSLSWREFVLGAAPAARIMVVPNYIGAAAPAVRPAGREIRIVFLGTVGLRKGVFDLLPAFKAALAQVPGMKLCLGGNGELAKAHALVERLQLQPAVEMPGWIAGREKARLLEGADVFVLPSYNEGLPMSILEAMACGVPVISTRVGGIPEVVRDQIDGLLIEAGDIGALAAALVRLARDPALRASLGRSARRRIESEYSPHAVLPRLEALYSELERKDSGRCAASPAS